MKRKVLALSLAGAMVFGTTMPALAATGTDENTTGNTVTGSGDVSYVDTTVYSVTLPTTATTSLVVDPQGLTGLTNGSTATADELEAYAGKITCASTPIVTNLSSVPMKVSVKLAMTGDATPVKTVEAVNDTTTKANNVLLYAVPSAADTKGVESNYIASTTGVVLSATEATVDFILPAAEYNYKKAEDGTITYEVVAGETGHGSGLSFGGYVNKHADWSDYVKETDPKAIGMTAVFTFTKTIADGEAADTTEGAPYGMKAYTGDKVTVKPSNAGPGIATTTYSVTEDTAFEVVVSLGSGNLAASTVSSALLKGEGSLELLDGSGTFATYAGGKLNLTAALATFIVNNPTVTLDVVFDDGTVVTLDFTV